jgi:hypothetical protein
MWGDLKSKKGGQLMTQKKFITLTVASAFAITSGIALAAGPNDAFKYPSAESHKQYSAYRNQDHNNASPRYPVTTTTNKNYATYRNQDHNNPSPRYAASTKQTATPTAEARSPQYTVRSTQRRVISRYHG